MSRSLSVKSGVRDEKVCQLTSTGGPKKGSSWWHGSTMYSRYTPQEIEENDNLLDYNITYFDHISTGDRKQDYVAVMSYFEAVCMHIVNRFPHIKNVYIQSDNAQCYKKGNLVFGLFKIAEENGLILRAFIHTGV
jgi:hypothetical protein